MKCFGRTVLSERKLGGVTIIHAVYAPGTIDPHHAHAFAHLSVVLSGDALEVRRMVPNRQRASSVSIQPRGASHVLFFPIQTEIVSLTAPSVHALTGCDAEEIAAMGDVRVLTAVRHFNRTKKKASNVGQHAAPQWLRCALRSFPWASSVPLREASRRCGVHPSHFARSFREHTGASPRAFRRRAKLRAAAHWLLSSDDTLSCVALECAFSDQSHLTSAFTAAFGVSPARFRRIFAQSS